MSESNSRRRQNLRRLLAPKHIAFIGGSDADYSARQCALRFNGPVWGVNPRRTEMGGQPCFPTVRDLPEAPDAVFLATPRSATREVISDLRDMGAGGVVCFTAGYGETGAEGKLEEKKLVEEAGYLSLVGPNCYGLINYIHDATLWPFGAGSSQCEKGVALIMQSGMITADMAMNQRSVPLAYVISAGNQAALAVEDFIDVLVDSPEVSAFGIYIEGIQDVGKFARSCLNALAANKPVVVMKAGSSSIGSRLAVSHTGSLSGADEAHDALFKRLGIVRVYSPEILLETLKFMTVSGIPKGNRVAAFTCSGGEALMVADYCENAGLELPQPSDESRRLLTSLLPDIATVSNPLDYTTPLWGNEEIMPEVFKAALSDGFDAAVFIQDYPPEEFDADNRFYRADGNSYMAAVNAAGIPAGICSELAENFDRESREIYVAGGVTPMQGFDRGLDAIVLASGYYRNRQQIMRDPSWQEFSRIECPSPDFGDLHFINARLINEWQSKKLLEDAGLSVPAGKLIAFDEANSERTIQDIEQIGYPLVVKLVSDEIAHKTEMGAVFVGVDSEESFRDSVGQIIQVVNDNDLKDKSQGILVEEMVSNTVHELLVGIKRDAQFGLVMVIASGGILVELYRDAVTLLLPVSENHIKQALSELKCYPLFNGYRGKPECDIDDLVKNILCIAHFAESRADNLLEMDVNPLLVTAERSVAVDALIRVSR
jgi:acyl-CoA synthetase (NDP forming)